MEKSNYLNARLFELCIQSANPDELAKFYGDALGYRFTKTDGVLYGVARDRRVTLREGKSKSLGYAAFAFDQARDLDLLAKRLDAAGVARTPIEMNGFDGVGISFRDPDGNEFRFGVPAADHEGQFATDLAGRLQHVVLASTDVERMLGFFTEVVGFTLSDRVLDDDDGLRTFFVRSNYEHHSLAVFAASENRLDHHCYEAVDWSLIRDWGDHFAERHIPLQWGPGRHGPGNNLFLFVHDTDGNWLEISAELEHVAADKPAGSWPHHQRTLNTWGIGLLRS